MHKCTYAEVIGADVYWITNEKGIEVCGFCHAPKTVAAKKTATPPVRKK